LNNAQHKKREKEHKTSKVHQDPWGKTTVQMGLGTEVKEELKRVPKPKHGQQKEKRVREVWVRMDCQ